jgi:hypothetical protein
MATWASLTQAQKDTVQAVVNPVRALAGNFAQLMNDAKDLGLAWNNGASAIVATLDAGESIPNGTGLADAAPLTKDKLVNLVGYYITVGATPDGSSGSYNTNYHRAVYLDAAGINAVV